jgi:peptidoglycan/LPS O-acetylase OafA/YrhL
VGRAPVLAWIGERKITRWLARVSYSIYLTHPLVERSIEELGLAGRLEDPERYVVFVAIALPAALVVAALLHRFVEAPWLRVRDRRVPT